MHDSDREKEGKVGGGMEYERQTLTPNLKFGFKIVEQDVTGYVQTKFIFMEIDKICKSKFTT